MNFWPKLAKPIAAVAPMANVTDAAFRKIISDIAKPSVMWTEFVSCEALCASEASRKKMMVPLQYGEGERPIVAQLFGSKPDQFYKSAQLIKQLGFDGIDINMGCPDKNVNKQGSGAALMLNHKLAQRIIQECKRGSDGLPVSVKIRIGYDEINYEDWVRALADTDPAAITIHGRTKKEMSLVPAHWDVIGDACHLIKSTLNSNALVLGNGDVLNIEDGHHKAQTYNLDGIMYGRSLFGNPWLFHKNKSKKNLPPQEVLEGLIKHTQYFQEMLSGPGLINFQQMKKSFRSYLSGIPNSKFLRERLMVTKNSQEVVDVVEEYLAYSSEMVQKDRVV